MARLDTIDDSEWDEVRFINGYAVFMGYLMMGIRGFGVLVITWTTVVLLGGFVSMLGKKDFWCLTGITLVQAAGVFNFILEDTLTAFVLSWWGLLGAAVAMVKKPFRKGRGKTDISLTRILLAFALSVIQVLVLATILCPSAVLYLCGMYISAGLSLWRLIEHDFGNPDGGANLKPALQVLYSLAVAQGVLFGYKTLHSFGAKFWLAEFMADLFSLDKKLLSDYLDDTVAGCEKDPSFAAGRNLVTYAVGLLMEAKTNDGFVAGVKVLGRMIINREQSREVLAAHLLTRLASSRHVLLRLLEIAGSRSQYSREFRKDAVNIVAGVASSIHLEHNPEWIQCISSLLNIFEELSWVLEEYKQGKYLSKEYERWLFLSEEDRPLNPETARGAVINLLCDYIREFLLILQRLANHEDNCRVIVNTEGLLPNITAALISDQLHRDHHKEWSRVTMKSLNLMERLAMMPGRTGTKLWSEISGSEKAIMCKLECLECGVWMKRRTVQILLYLSVDTSSIMAGGSSGRIFTWIVLLVLLFFLSRDYSIDEIRLPPHQKKISDISRLAREKLSDLVSSNQELSTMLTSQSDEGSDPSMLQSVRVVLGDLTRALLDAGNISNRVHAARILQNLCDKYHKDDEYLKELKNAIANVMPEVLKEVLCYVFGREAVTEASSVQLQEIIVSASGGCPHGNAQGNTSSAEQQHGEQPEDKKLQEALVDLCRAIRWKWYPRDKDLTRRLDEIAEKVCSEQGKPVKNFSYLVSEADEILSKLLLDEIAEKVCSEQGKPVKYLVSEAYELADEFVSKLLEE